MIDQKTINDLIRLAQRYPSPHNIQPAAWSIHQSGQIKLFSREARRLFVGDPGRRDHLISLGAAWECMNIAANHVGFRLTNETVEPNPTHVKGDETLLVRSAALTSNDDAKDPIASQIEARRCFRGVFKQKLSAEKLQSLSAIGWNLISEQQALHRCASLHDQATMSFMAERSFCEELYHWLRLTDDHPSYHKDGLNREAMSLGKAEGWIANWLLRPGVFRILKKFGLGTVVVTEAQPIRSASAIAILTAEPNETPFDSGRKLMRAWLKMTELGVSGCPISSSTDQEDCRKKLLSIAGLSENTTVIVALRIGPTPAGTYLSPRLANEDIIIKV